jgi:hypothetical protein
VLRPSLKRPSLPPSAGASLASDSILYYIFRYYPVHVVVPRQASPSPNIWKESLVEAISNIRMTEVIVLFSGRDGGEGARACGRPVQLLILLIIRNWRGGGHILISRQIPPPAIFGIFCPPTPPTSSTNQPLPSEPTGCPCLPAPAPRDSQASCGRVGFLGSFCGSGVSPSCLRLLAASLLCLLLRARPPPGLD